MKRTFLNIGLVVGIAAIFLGTSIIPVIRGEYQAEDFSGQSSASTIDWWPMFHHDLTHSGFSISSGPRTNTVAWSFTTESLILSAPAVVDGKVFVGSGNKYYCLDAESGAPIWECIINGFAEGNPAVDSGRVYLPLRSQYDENKLFCLNADTGSYFWNYTGCYWPFNPVVYDGKVFFGSLDGSLRCLNALDGTLVWSYSTGSTGTSNAPAISNDKVYFGAGDGKMYCLDASDGDYLWNWTTGAQIMECPAVSDGRLYFGSSDYLVYCLNAETGESIWNITTGYVVDSTPAVAYGKVYIGSRDCTLYCLDAETGQYEWSYYPNGQVDSSPAVANGKVYFGSDDNYVYCLDAETGIKIWDYMTGSYVMSSPAVANGKVYIGSYDTNLYCFGDELAADFTWTPTEPSHGQTVTFNASTSSGSITLYEWDWENDGVFDEASPVPTATHLWPDPGSSPVTLRVTDNTNQTAVVTKTVTIGNQAPNPPMVTGPAEGKAKTATEYNFTSADSDGDNLSYFIDWGDGQNTSWIGPYTSGENIVQSHVWAKKGTYIIKAKVKDVYGAESDWGTLSITMPLSYAPPHARFFEWVFDRFPHAFPVLRQMLGY